MKTFTKIDKYFLILVAFLVFALAFTQTYKAGFNTGRDLTKNRLENYRLKVIDSIAQRYFLEIGNPSTLEQHCTFVRVVYNDQTECK